MDYTSVNTTAYGFMDRTDAETTAMYDSFLRLVEARINRLLKTLKMTTRSTLLLNNVNDHYGLPTDYSGMRDVRLNLPPGTSGKAATITGELLSPSQINELKNTTISSFNEPFYYCVINDQIQIYPIQDNTKTLELVYYRRVQELSPTEITNWLSEDFPDCYVYGVCEQIGRFVKDYPAANEWKAQFETALSEIIDNDFDERWNSDNPLTVRVV